MYNKLNPDLIEQLRKIVGKDQILIDEERMEPYSHDKVVGLKADPEVVVKVDTKEQIREIARRAKINRIPIRVGVNSGSLRSLSAVKPPADRMVESALDYVKILEGSGFFDTVISLKASNILDTVESYSAIIPCIWARQLQARLLAEQ